MVNGVVIKLDIADSKVAIVLVSIINVVLGGEVFIKAVEVIKVCSNSIVMAFITHSTENVVAIYKGCYPIIIGKIDAVVAPKVEAVAVRGSYEAEQVSTIKIVDVSVLTSSVLELSSDFTGTMEPLHVVVDMPYVANSL